MGQHILSGNPPVAITLRQSRRARRISLRVSGVDGKVTLTIPYGIAEREALDFARQKEGWLRTQLDKQPDWVPVAHGAFLPLEGTPMRIASGSGRSVRVENGQLLVPGAPERVPARLQAWLKTLARERLATASDRYAAVLGRPYTRITLRDTRSRWGSCTSDGALMYSWRLVLAPPEVLNYVAAHEVAHLAEMNHSHAFWALLERLCPGHAPHRLWLRENGASLHRYRFGD